MIKVNLVKAGENEASLSEVKSKFAPAEQTSKYQSSLPSCNFHPPPPTHPDNRDSRKNSSGQELSSSSRLLIVLPLQQYSTANPIESNASTTPALSIAHDGENKADSWVAQVQRLPR